MAWGDDDGEDDDEGDDDGWLLPGVDDEGGGPSGLTNNSCMAALNFFSLKPRICYIVRA